MIFDSDQETRKTRRQDVYHLTASIQSKVLCKIHEVDASIKPTAVFAFGNEAGAEVSTAAE